jgi:hypothetical protein
MITAGGDGASCRDGRGHGPCGWRPRRRSSAAPGSARRKRFSARPGGFPGAVRAASRIPAFSRHGIIFTQHMDYTESRMHSTILIVDIQDDRDIRSLLADYLETNGYRAWRGRRQRHVEAAGRSAPRPDRARPEHARRRWPDPVPQAARAFDPAGDHADRPQRAAGPHPGPGNGRRRLPAQAVRAARAAGPHPQRAAPQP